MDTPRRVIEAMPATSRSRALYERMTADVRNMAGHEPTDQTRDHIAVLVLLNDNAALAIRSRDVLGVVAVLAEMSTLSMAAIARAEGADVGAVMVEVTDAPAPTAQPTAPEAPRPFTKDDVLNAHDAMPDTLPDFGPLN